MLLISSDTLQHLQDDTEDLKSHRNPHFSAREKVSFPGGMPKTTNCVKKGKCFCTPHQAPNPAFSQTVPTRTPAHFHLKCNWAGSPCRGDRD